MNAKLLAWMILAVVFACSLCASTPDYTYCLVAINSAAKHDEVATNNDANTRPIGTMGYQIKLFLKDGKPMITTVNELKISTRLAWAVYLHERENMGIYRIPY